MRISPYLALVPVCAGVFVAADDQTVVVTVLPQMMRDMGVQINELDRIGWTITGYLLGYVAAMPVIGKLSDAWGHRRVYAWCVVLFIVGSAAVAMMPTLSWLVAARIFQAIGAGALVPISIAIVGDLFPPGRRGIPLGLMGAAAEAGGVIGPLWGGIIIRYLDWRWVFWINIPLGILVLIGLLLLLRPSPRYHTPIDYRGGALITLTLAAMTLGLARVGDPDALMAAYLAVSVAALALFVWRQRSAIAPLLPPSMFRGWTFNAANLTHVLAGGALIIGMVTIPLIANTVMQRTPLEGGLLLMRMTIGMPVGAIAGGIACQRMGYRIPTIAGLALAAIGFGFMSRWDLAVGDLEATTHLVVAGIGFGLLIAPIALAATDAVSHENRGTAAGVVTATRIVGMTLGLAALTAWGTGRFHTLVAGMHLPFPLPGETASESQQRVQEFQETVTGIGLNLFNDFFLVAMVVCLIAILPAAMMLGRRRKNGTDAEEEDAAQHS